MKIGSLLGITSRELTACRTELIRHAPVIDWTEEQLDCTCGWHCPSISANQSEDWQRHLQRAVEVTLVTDPEVAAIARINGEVNFGPEHFANRDKCDSCLDVAQKLYDAGLRADPDLRSAPLCGVVLVTCQNEAGHPGDHWSPTQAGVVPRATAHTVPESEAALATILNRVLTTSHGPRLANGSDCLCVVHEKARAALSAAPEPETTRRSDREARLDQ